MPVIFATRHVKRWTIYASTNQKEEVLRCQKEEKL